MGDHASHAVADGVMIELGQLYAAEERKVVLTLDVPAMPALGLTQVAEIELAWVELPSLESHTVTVPVHVNVVPGDQAAQRIADPKVRTELAYQRAQEAKREAAEALRRGDTAGAARVFGAASDELACASPVAPSEMAAEIEEEADLLRDLSRRAVEDEASRVSKFSEADRARKGRLRAVGGATA